MLDIDSIQENKHLINSFKSEDSYEKNYKRIFKKFEKYLEKWSSQSTKKQVEHKVQVIDFFSGCGGTSLGFSTIGNKTGLFKVIGGLDINSDACKSFEENFGVPCLNEDIANLAEDKSKLEEYLKLIKYDRKKPTVLIGCAPCQGFTTHRKKHWSKSEDDERNSLILEFSKIASILQPEVIIMENVPELLSGKYWHHFEEFKKEMGKSGYAIKQSIYNAASFGVPQERFRALVVAMKSNFNLPVDVYNPKSFKTVRDAIENLKVLNAGEKDPEDYLHKSATHRKSTLDTIKAVPKNGGNRPAGVGPKCLDKVKGFSDVYGRLYWDRPSITITHYARNPASGRFTHPELDRGLTGREASLLQSFPRKFFFHGSFDSRFKQIGEAVPPKLGLSIAVSTLLNLIGVDEVEDLNDLVITEPVSSSYSSVIAGLKAKRNKNV